MLSTTHENHVRKQTRHVDAKSHVGDDLLDDIALSLCILISVDSSEELQDEKYQKRTIGKSKWRQNALRRKMFRTAQQPTASVGILAARERDNRKQLTARSSLTSPFFSGGFGAAILPTTRAEAWLRKSAGWKQA